MTLTSGGGGGEHSLSASALESAVALLAHLETDQLEKMNEDETELINIINDSDIVKSLQTEREDMVSLELLFAPIPVLSASISLLTHLNL